MQAISNSSRYRIGPMSMPEKPASEGWLKRVVVEVVRDANPRSVCDIEKPPLLLNKLRGLPNLDYPGITDERQACQPERRSFTKVRRCESELQFSIRCRGLDTCFSRPSVELKAGRLGSPVGFEPGK